MGQSKLLIGVALLIIIGISIQRQQDNAAGGCRRRGCLVASQRVEDKIRISESLIPRSLEKQAGVVVNVNNAVRLVASLPRQHPHDPSLLQITTDFKVAVNQSGYTIFARVLYYYFFKEKSECT